MIKYRKCNIFFSKRIIMILLLLHLIVILIFIALKRCTNFERVCDVHSIPKACGFSWASRRKTSKVMEWGLKCGWAFMWPWMTCPQLYAYEGSIMPTMHYERTHRLQDLMPFHVSFVRERLKTLFLFLTFNK